MLRAIKFAEFDRALVSSSQSAAISTTVLPAFSNNVFLFLTYDASCELLGLRVQNPTGIGNLKSRPLTACVVISPAYADAEQQRNAPQASWTVWKSLIGAPSVSEN